MKTTLPRSITNITGAKDFLRSLFLNGESYHPEDSAADIVNTSTGRTVFTTTEAKQLDRLMREIYALKEIDPCEYLLELDFRKEQFIDEFEEVSGYKVWTVYELNEEEKPGDYGDPDRFVTVSNDEGRIVVLGFTNGIFYLVYAGVQVDDHRIGNLFKHITEAFKTV